MKKIILFGSISLLFLSACENPVRMETKVSEDGSLEKTIILEKVDKIREHQNMFGISEKNGWTINAVEEEQLESDSSSTEAVKYNLAFKKSFASAALANAELNQELDTLFGIHAIFEKRFRWFYTYIRYSETFRPIDRFKKIKSDDYFNQEDKAFINRLTGDGTAISKADSLFLNQLNEKIYDRYTEDALFNELYDILRDVVNQNTTEKKWLDTLARSRDFIRKKLDDWDGDKTFAAKIADTLGIPLPKEKAAQDFARLSKAFNSRVAFMSSARDAEYTNIMEMPWSVMNSNADSVAGNRAYFRPLPTKFAVQPYTMFAETRKMNLWAVIVSGLIVVVSVFVVVKRKN